MKSVVVRIVRSDGQEMTLGTGTPWRIPNDGLEGFADLDYSIETSANVLTDGSSLVSKRVSERDRTISADYWGDDPDNARIQAMAFFNPKHSYECHVTYRGVTRWCEGEQYGFKCDPNNAYDGMVQITWTLLCLDPYMRGEDIRDESMQDASPMFTFPFQSFVPNATIPSGCVSSLRVYDGLNTIYNNGGVAAPFRISCEFGAAIVNPTFHINGKFVQVVTSFVAGDLLVIDFMAAPPTVTVNGDNTIQKCSRDSVFVGQVLDVGSNEFWYEVEQGDVNTMTVSIVHYDRYLGV